MTTLVVFAIFAFVITISIILIKRYKNFLKKEYTYHNNFLPKFYIFEKKMFKCSFYSNILSVLSLKLSNFFSNWVLSTNHRRIAIMYFLFTIISGFTGLVLATVIRIELAYPGQSILVNNAEKYLTIISLHGIIMVFFMIIPIIFGAFGNFLLPTQLGIRDVAFPRLNSFMFWVTPSGFVMLLHIILFDKSYNLTYWINYSELKFQLRRRYFFSQEQFFKYTQYSDDSLLAIRFKKLNNSYEMQDNLLYESTPNFNFVTTSLFKFKNSNICAFSDVAHLTSNLLHSSFISFFSVISSTLVVLFSLVSNVYFFLISCYLNLFYFLNYNIYSYVSIFVAKIFVTNFNYFFNFKYSAVYIYLLYVDIIVYKLSINVNNSIFINHLFFSVEVLILSLNNTLLLLLENVYVSKFIYNDAIVVFATCPNFDCYATLFVSFNFFTSVFYFEVFMLSLQLDLYDIINFKSLCLLYDNFVFYFILIDVVVVKMSLALVQFTSVDLFLFKSTPLFYTKLLSTLELIFFLHVSSKNFNLSLLPNNLFLNVENNIVAFITPFCISSYLFFYNLMFYVVSYYSYITSVSLLRVIQIYITMFYFFLQYDMFEFCVLTWNLLKFWFTIFTFCLNSFVADHTSLDLVFYDFFKNLPIVFESCIDIFYVNVWYQRTLLMYVSADVVNNFQVLRLMPDLSILATMRLWEFFIDILLTLSTFKFNSLCNYSNYCIKKNNFNLFNKYIHTSQTLDLFYSSNVFFNISWLNSNFVNNFYYSNSIDSCNKDSELELNFLYSNLYLLDNSYIQNFTNFSNLNFKSFSKFNNVSAIETLHFFSIVDDLYTHNLNFFYKKFFAKMRNTFQLSDLYTFSDLYYSINLYFAFCANFSIEFYFIRLLSANLLLTSELLSFVIVSSQELRNLFNNFFICLSCISHNIFAFNNTFIVTILPILLNFRMTQYPLYPLYLFFDNINFSQSLYNFSELCFLFESICFDCNFYYLILNYSNFGKRTSPLNPLSCVSDFPLSDFANIDTMLPINDDLSSLLVYYYFRFNDYVSDFDLWTTNKLPSLGFPYFDISKLIDSIPHLLCLIDVFTFINLNNLLPMLDYNVYDALTDFNDFNDFNEDFVNVLFLGSLNRVSDLPLFNFVDIDTMSLTNSELLSLLPYYYFRLNDYVSNFNLCVIDALPNVDFLYFDICDLADSAPHLFYFVDTFNFINSSNILSMLGLNVYNTPINYNDFNENLINTLFFNVELPCFNLINNAYNVNKLNEFFYNNLLLKNLCLFQNNAHSHYTISLKNLQLFSNFYVKLLLNMDYFLDWKELRLEREIWRSIDDLSLARRHWLLRKKYYANFYEPETLINKVSIWFPNHLIPGWAFVTPYTSRLRYTALGKVDIALVVILMASVGSTFSSINYVITYRYIGSPIFKNRKELRSFFIDALLVSSRMMILANPALIIGILLLLSDRHFGTSVFDFSGGGDTILFQHLFWFFGHPEVYIIIIPCFGFMNSLLPYYLKKRLSGRLSLQFSIYTIAFMGFAVWGHHMYMVGLANSVRTLYSTMTIMISVPASTKVLHWCVTIINSTISCDVGFLFLLSFMYFFVLGGLSGMFLAHIGFDVIFHDTFYVIGHFHVLLAGAAMSCVFAAFYFYFPAIFGVKYSRLYAYLHFFFYTSGQLLTLVPMFWLGYAGMPRRIMDYPSIFGGWHSIISSGHILTFLSLVFFLLMIFDSLYESRSPISKTKGVSRLNTRLSLYVYEIRKLKFFKNKILSNKNSYLIGSKPHHKNLAKLELSNFEYVFKI